MEYFIHLLEFQVIVCKECQYTVLPSFIHLHFQATPQYRLEKEERQRIIEAVVEVDGLISNNEALRQCKFLFPPPTSKPIAALAALKKDFIQCTLETVDRVCRYLCSIIQGMWNHYYREHLCKSKNKGGYRKKCNNTNVPQRIGVHC